MHAIPQDPPQDLPPTREPGCGWFESSHELLQGLDVEELGDGLPAAPWLAQTGPAPRLGS